MNNMFNFNFETAEVNLILAGLSELQVKTGAAHLMMKIEQVAKAQEQARSAGTNDIEIATGDDLEEI